MSGWSQGLFRRRTLWVGWLLLVGAASTAHAAHREILIETDGTNFKIVAQTVRSQDPPQMYRQTLQEGFYYLEAVDASGTVVEVRSLPDPSEVLYDYPESENPVPPSDSAAPRRPQPLRGGHVKLPTATLVVRLPLEAGVETFRIAREHRAGTAPWRSAAAQALTIPTTTPGPLPAGISLQPLAVLELSDDRGGAQP